MGKRKGPLVVVVFITCLFLTQGISQAANKFGAIAIGIPGEKVGENAWAGAVNIIYGSSGGLNSVNNQIWNKESPGIIGDSENDGNFGASLAAGDFNDDGFIDLAVGVDYEDVGESVDAGAVTVIYGSTAGLSSVRNQLWHQDSTGIEGEAGGSDHFGRSLAAGDFNDDGFVDLAVGVDYEDVGGALDAGAVNIFYGSSTGLNSANNQHWYQGAPGIVDDAENNDRSASGIGRRC